MPGRILTAQWQVAAVNRGPSRGLVAAACRRAAAAATGGPAGPVTLRTSRGYAEVFTWRLPAWGAAPREPGLPASATAHRRTAAGSSLRVQSTERGHDAVGLGRAGSAGSCTTGAGAGGGRCSPGALSSMTSQWQPGALEQQAAYGRCRCRIMRVYSGLNTRGLRGMGSRPTWELDWGEAFQAALYSPSTQPAPST